MSLVSWYQAWLDRREKNREKWTNFIRWSRDRLDPPPKPGIRRLVLELDDLDYQAIHDYIADYQACSQRIAPGKLTLIPDGESNLAGAIMAECVRDLLEYRGLALARCSNWEEDFRVWWESGPLQRKIYECGDLSYDKEEMAAEVAKVSFRMGRGA